MKRIIFLPKIIKYSFASNKQLIQQCYFHPSIKKRVQLLRQFSIQKDQPLTHEFQIELPFTFKMISAKQLNQFHKQNKTQQNVIILHALAFIQLNAFLSYADTLFRFAYLQKFNKLWECSTNIEKLQFKKQIQKIALDQGEHCLLLCKRLDQLGFKFGDFPVISNLNNTLHQSKQSLMQRLALISIVHEGRGMKSIDKLINKIKNSKDQKSAKILQKIKSQQSYHYQTGLKWFKYFSKSVFYRKLQQNKGQKQIANDQVLMQRQVNAINHKYKCNIQLSQLQS